MVKIVTQYKAKDGRLFDNKIDAMTHELKLEVVGNIRDMFPKQSNLGNGEYYLIPYTVYRTAKRMAVAAFYQELGDNMRGTILDFSNGHRGTILGRYLNDANSPLYSVWMLFECIDDKHQMFNQPYFVHNPPAKPIEISY